jgi:hypothetical protein
MSPLHYYYSIIQGFVHRYFCGLRSFFSAAENLSNLSLEKGIIYIGGVT